jgi:hypothetical protein
VRLIIAQPGVFGPIAPGSKASRLITRLATDADTAGAACRAPGSTVQVHLVLGKPGLC